MTVAYDSSFRGWSSGSHGAVCLEDKFEVLKDVGDGSFGSVSLARVRSAGAHIARRGTLVAIKTMKKTFDNFNQCLELREVIFLRSLPNHPHLVPSLDIFLDPMSKKLHIAMEYMDGNLYQLMKARDHKRLDCSTVKSILFQIISGLEHIHENNFFHRDIKPENILVSTSAPDTGNAFKRYSSLVTPPSTPPSYTIKIADFGLARETHSKLPYTTYVSTRWYRAPEVLLRAGEYSAPVDIWAVGAMAVEIATLKPLFPGGNEVDQVWRVCEIMGSPGSWVNKHGAKVGGGEWKDGIRLAQKLGFSFPKMAPHAMDTILQSPEWPASLAQFVTWCLMWDPKSRPTSTQALCHEFFQDAVDPLRPKSSASRFLNRKHSDMSNTSGKDSTDTPSLTSKTSSWFRKSLVARDSSPAVPQHISAPKPLSPQPSPQASNTSAGTLTTKQRRDAAKRATWTNGVSGNGAPMQILPSIRPISPLPDAVTAQANQTPNANEKATKKIGRQLSLASHGNHYADIHRAEAERALNGGSGLASPSNPFKEGFFSHLRKRARRLSGRYQAPPSPSSGDIEASAGCLAWGSSSNRHSMNIDPPPAPTSNPMQQSDFAEMDKALQHVRYSLEGLSPAGSVKASPSPRVASNPMLKRHHSLPHGSDSNGRGPVSSRTRRAVQQQPSAGHRYETPNEEEELLDEALLSAHKASKRMASGPTSNPAYLTPSPSANRNVSFGNGSYSTPTKPVEIAKRQQPHAADPKWPTPPYEENEWAAAAAASIFAAQNAYR
ncbi:meiosis induction protein kinase [Diplodia corticola]|uniref:Meiosis induction protein kinase n=1 Tax=Diplodia corticola TaxID=236234 RepID=A0A1J9RB56_9PEZI|nr:meiosis induction protein kinase [Diplodia corticola]OJD37705.1 meiosis induction protein kinase [Diplodia corticola]